MNRCPNHSVQFRDVDSLLDLSCSRIDYFSSLVTNHVNRDLQAVFELDKLYHEACQKIDCQFRNGTLNTAKYEALSDSLRFLCDQKLALVSMAYDMVDSHILIIDEEIALNQERVSLLTGIPTDSQIQQRSVNPNLRRKRKRNELTVAEAVALADPNDPVYCSCRRVAFGRMVACDNADCPHEWFHFSCVGLSRRPKDAWICPQCALKAANKMK